MLSAHSLHGDVQEISIALRNKGPLIWLSSRNRWIGCAAKGATVGAAIGGAVNGDAGARAPRPRRESPPASEEETLPFRPE